MSWFNHRPRRNSADGISLFKGPFSVAVGPAPASPSGQKSDQKPAEPLRPLGWRPGRSIFG